MQKQVHILLIDQMPKNSRSTLHLGRRLANVFHNGNYITLTNVSDSNSIGYIAQGKPAIHIRSHNGPRPAG